MLPNEVSVLPHANIVTAESGLRFAAAMRTRANSTFRQLLPRENRMAGTAGEPESGMVKNPPMTIRIAMLKSWSNRRIAGRTAPHATMRA